MGLGWLDGTGQDWTGLDRTGRGWTGLEGVEGNWTVAGSSTISSCGSLKGTSRRAVGPLSLAPGSQPAAYKRGSGAPQKEGGFFITVVDAWDRWFPTAHGDPKLVLSLPRLGRPCPWLTSSLGKKSFGSFAHSHPSAWRCPRCFHHWTWPDYLTQWLLWERRLRGAESKALFPILLGTSPTQVCALGPWRN